MNGHAAMIHPMLPPIRISPNSFLRSLICAKAIEFEIESVGTYRRQWTIISRKNGQNSFVNANPQNGHSSN